MLSNVDFGALFPGAAPRSRLFSRRYARCLSRTSETLVGVMLAPHALPGLSQKLLVLVATCGVQRAYIFLDTRLPRGRPPGLLAMICYGGSLLRKLLLGVRRADARQE